MTLAARTSYLTVRLGRRMGWDGIRRPKVLYHDCTTAQLTLSDTAWHPPTTAARTSLNGRPSFPADQVGLVRRDTPAKTEGSLAEEPTGRRQIAPSFRHGARRHNERATLCPFFFSFSPLPLDSLTSSSINSSTWTWSCGRWPSIGDGQDVSCHTSLDKFAAIFCMPERPGSFGSNILVPRITGQSPSLPTPFTFGAHQESC